MTQSSGQGGGGGSGDQHSSQKGGGYGLGSGFNQYTGAYTNEAIEGGKRGRNIGGKQSVTSMFNPEFGVNPLMGVPQYPTQTSPSIQNPGTGFPAQNPSTQIPGITNPVQGVPTQATSFNLGLTPVLKDILTKMMTTKGLGVAIPGVIAAPNTPRSSPIETLQALKDTFLGMILNPIQSINTAQGFYNDLFGKAPNVLKDINKTTPASPGGQNFGEHSQFEELNRGTK